MAAPSYRGWVVAAAFGGRVVPDVPCHLRVPQGSGPPAQNPTAKAVEFWPFCQNRPIAQSETSRPRLCRGRSALGEWWGGSGGEEAAASAAADGY